MLRPAMAAYSSELWHDFFIGAAGAAAALTGLLFVSLSINLEQILGRSSGRPDCLGGRR